MNNRILEYILKLKDEASKEAEKAASNISSAMKSAETGSKILLGTIAATSAATVAYGYKAIQAYNAQAEVMQKLNTIMLNIEGNTQSGVDMLIKQASAIQNLGVIGDETIISMQAQLATFDLQAESIAKLTPALVDMMVAEKGINATIADGQSIAEGFGQALLGNYGALSRRGFKLTEDQKKIIELGNETEKITVLTEVLGSTYDGVNAAMRETFQGQMIAATNTIGDFNELIGQTISEKLRPIIVEFNNWIDSIGGADGLLKIFNEKVSQLNQWMPIITGAIAFGLVPALGGLAKAIWLNIAPLIPFMVIGAGVGLLIQTLIEKFGGWEQVTLQLVNVYNQFLKPALDVLWETISTQLLPELIKLWEVLEPILIPVLKLLAVVAGGTVVAGLRGMIYIVQGVVDWVTKAVNAVNRFIDTLKALPQLISQAMEKAGELLNKINPFHRESPSLVDNVMNGVKLIRKEYESLADLTLPSINSQFSPALTGANGGVVTNNNHSFQAPININANINNDMDAHELAQILGFELQMRSRG